MLWYGWIPILSDKLLVPQLFGAFLEKQQIHEDPEDHGKLLLCPRLISDKNLKKAFSDSKGRIGQALAPADREGLYVGVESYDDAHPQSLSWLGFTECDGRITRAGVFSFTENGLCVVATIQSISENGLVVFDVAASRADAQVFAKYLFAIIRDVYHEHVYIQRGDFALFPVEANDEKSALRGIANQYRAKIVDYHSLIRGLASLPKETTGYVPSVAHVHMLRGFVAQGKGEMAYARSFSWLFDIPSLGKSAMNSSESLAVLETKVDTLSEASAGKISPQLFVFSGFGLFFSAHSALTNNLLGDLAPSEQTGYAFLFTVGILVILYFFNYLDRLGRVSTV